MQANLLYWLHLAVMYPSICSPSPLKIQQKVETDREFG